MFEYLLANLLGVFLAGGLAGAAIALLAAWPFERRRVRRLKRTAFRACMRIFQLGTMTDAAVDAAIAAAKHSKVDKGAK